MIKENIKQLRDEINSVCQRSGRNRDDVRLVAISKTVSPEDILDAYSEGIKSFGENKVQELLSKYDKLPDDIEWHLVGHLQTNKVKYIVDKVSLIHSVDSYRLAEEISRQAQKIERTVPCLIQVNTSGEISKYGVSPDEVERLIAQVSALSRVSICGFMTMAPFTDEQTVIRNCFRRLSEIRLTMARIFESCCFDILSMGMSSDYELAVEEGATLLRIGTAVFGERNN